MNHSKQAWRIPLLIGCQLMALVLVLSWVWSGTRVLWDQLDDVVFYALNGSLAIGGLWQDFWAIANWRPFDLVAGSAILLFILYWVRNGSVGTTNQRIWDILLFVILVVLINQAVHKGLNIPDFKRDSPTEIHTDVYRLSEVFPGIKIKDQSGDCFPADHVFILMMLVFFLWRHEGTRRGLIAMACLFPFMMPRLVGGAHWLTDTVVGAGAMVLVGWSLWFATPLRQKALVLTENLDLVALARTLSQRIPGVRQFVSWFLVTPER